MTKISWLLVATYIFCSCAQAQTAAPNPAPVSVLVGTVPLAVSNTSARVALPASGSPYIGLTICNDGSVDAYFALGDVTVTATTNSFVSKAGSCLSGLWAANASYLAAITSGSGVTALTIYQGNGPLPRSSSAGNASGPYQVTYIGHQTALTLASSTALTPTAGATIADIVVEANGTYGAAVRCLLDGSVPTPTTGLELAPGASLHIVTGALANVKCIQETASAAIDVQYGR